MAADKEAARLKRLHTFREVANDRLVKMNVAWMNFEQQGGGSEPARELLRELHTIKGEASLMGFPSIASLAHAIEDALEPIAHAAGRIPDPDVGDKVLEALDLMQEFIDDDPSLATPAADRIIAGLGALRGEQPPSADAGSAAVASAPASAVAEPEPDPDKPETPAPAVQPAASGAKSSAPSKKGSARAGEAVRVTSDKLDRIRDMIGELLLTRVRLAGSAHELRKARDLTAEFRADLVEQSPQAARFLQATMETLGGIENRLRAQDHEMDRLITELESTSRELRLVPINTLFEQYPRAVRSLARDLGKKVRVVTSEEPVEIDRSVLKAIEEPLLHLVRNAVDHGIEKPDERNASGKSQEGTLRLDAQIAGGRLEITVSDDGAGIPVERVRRKAVERGLVAEQDAGHLTDEQVIRLLFASGFSTREQVTATSGRGVGLDVVAASVESIGGTVNIESSQDSGRQGTTFFISVPISVAITSILLFVVGDGRYALAASSVESVVDSEDHPVVDSVHGAAIRYHDQLIPLLDVARTLGETTNGGDQSGDRQDRLIIVRSGLDFVAIQGTSDHTEREVVMKSAGTFFDEHPLVRAVVPLEDGTLSLVLRAKDLVAIPRGLGTRHIEPTEGRARHVPSVLVVDDSPVIRDLLAEALRSHGLRVIEAGDGEEALVVLEANDDLDLVVTDIDMPRLDGIGLIQAIRARGGRRIPTVVVSMRGTDSDKQRAIDAGADAYLVKTDFSHKGLWTMIGRFLE